MTKKLVDYLNEVENQSGEFDFNSDFFPSINPDNELVQSQLDQIDLENQMIEAGKNRLQSVDYFDENAVVSQGRQSLSTNMWNSFMNAIDEIDESRYKGKSIELQHELNNTEDQSRASEIEQELLELEEDIKTQQDDIADSPVDIGYKIKQEEELAREKSNVFDWLQYEAPKEFGGTASEWGTQAALLAKDAGMHFVKNAIKTSLIEALGPEAAPVHGLIAGALTAADLAIDIFTLYKMRERETYAEMADVFEQNHSQVISEYLSQTGKTEEELTPVESKDLFEQAYQGLSEFKAKQMSLSSSDILQRALVVVPWTKGFNKLTGFNKYTRALGKVSGLALSGGSEGGEEGAQFSFGKDYLAGKFSEDFNYFDAIVEGNKELGKAGLYTLGLSEHRFQDDPEFRNSVRSGAILGGVMGGSSNVIGLGRDLYDYKTMKANTNNSTQSLFGDEKNLFKAGQFTNVLSKGDSNLYKETLRGLKNSQSDVFNDSDVEDVLKEFRQAEAIYSDVNKKVNRSGVKKKESTAKSITNQLILNGFLQKENKDSIEQNDKSIDRYLSEDKLSKESVEFLKLKREALSERLVVDKDLAKQGKAPVNLKSRIEYIQNEVTKLDSLIDEKEKSNTRYYDELPISNKEVIKDALKNNIGFESQNSTLEERRSYLENVSNYKEIENQNNKDINDAVEQAVKKFNEKAKTANTPKEVREAEKDLEESIKSVTDESDEEVKSQVDGAKNKTVGDQDQESPEVKVPDPKTKDLEKNLNDFQDSLQAHYKGRMASLDNDISKMFGALESAELTQDAGLMSSFKLNALIDPSNLIQKLTELYSELSYEGKDIINSFYISKEILKDRVSDTENDVSVNVDESSEEEVIADNKSLDTKTFFISGGKGTKLFIFQRGWNEEKQRFEIIDISHEELKGKAYLPDYEHTNRGGVSVGDGLIIRVDKTLIGYQVKSGTVDENNFNAVLVHTDASGIEHVVGFLPNIDRNSKQYKPDQQRSLQKLRKTIWDSFSDRDTVFDYEYPIKVEDVYAGRLSNSFDENGNPVFNNPVDVVRSEEDLVFGYTDDKGALQVPNAENLPIEYSKTKLTKRVRGMFLLLKGANGSIIPVKVYKKKVREVEGKLESIMKIIDNIQEDTPIDAIRKSLNKHLGVPKNRIEKSNGSISIKKKKDDKWVKISFDSKDITNREELENFIKDTIVSTDDFQLNKKDYNSRISNEGLVAVNITPKAYVHSATIEADFSTGLPVETISDVEVDNLNQVEDNTEEAVESVPVDTIEENENPFSEFGDDEIDEFFSNTITSYNRETWDKESELSWFKNNFSLPVQILNNLREIAESGGEDAFGLFKNGTVYLTENTSKGTIYHEAFHAVFRLYLNDIQRTALVDEAKNNYSAPSKEDLTRLNSLYSSKFSEEEITELYYEERIAEEFRNYVDTEGINENTIPSRIKNFIKRVYLLAKELVKKSLSMNEYFFLANQGNYKNKKLPQNSYKFSEPAFSVSGMTSAETVHAIKIINRIALTVGKDKVVGEDKSLKEALIQAKGQEEKKLMLRSIYNEARKIIGNSLNKRFKAGTISDEAIRFGKIMLNSLKGGKLLSLSIQDLSRVGIIYNINNNVKVSEENAKGIQNDDLIFEETNENIEYKQKWNEDQLTISQYESLSDKLKIKLNYEYLRLDNNFKPEVNKLGFKEYEDGNKLYNYLLNKISGSYSVEDMMEKLENLIQYKPSLNQLLEDVNKDSDLLTDLWIGVGQLTRFDFLLVNQVTKKENNKKKDIFTVSIANNIRPESKIIRQMSDRFSGEITDSFKSEIEKTIVSIKNMIESLTVGKKTISKRALVNVFNTFGVSISEDELNIDKSTGEGAVRLIVHTLKGLSKLGEVLMKGVDPIGAGGTSAILAKQSAKAISNFTNSISQDSIRSGSKTYYAYTSPSFLSKQIWKLNNINKDKKENIYSEDQFYKESVWYKKIVKDGIKMNYTVLDRLKRRGEFEGTEYTKMSKAHLMSTMIHSWFNGGLSRSAYYPTSILSDGSKMMFIEFPKLNPLEGEIDEAIYSSMLQEIGRITSDTSSLPYKEGRDDTFNLGIANKTFNSQLKSNGKEWMLNPENKQTIIDNARFEIDEKFQEFKDLLISNELIREEKDSIVINENQLDTSLGKGDALNSNLKAYFEDSLIGQSQVITLFAGDPAFYKSNEDFFKRVKQIYSPGTYIDTEAKFKGDLKSTFADNISSKYKTIYLKDSENAYDQAEEIYNNLIKSGLSKELASDIAGRYGYNTDKKVNEADAQAYVDIKRYRDVMIGLREWTQQHEDALPNLISGKATASELRLVMQPIKPFLFTHTTIGNKVVPVQNKNAEFLLLPQLAKGNKGLENILEVMGYDFTESETTLDLTKRKADSVQYESAVKVGGFDQNITEDITKIEDNKIVTLNNDDYRLQQKTPAHHVDSSNIFGTQLRKLGISDLKFSNEDGSDYMYTLPNGENISGRKLVLQYNAIIAADIKVDYEDLIHELGVEDEEPTTALRKVLKVLREEVIKRGLGEDYLKALDFVEETGKSRVPLYHPSIVNRVEAIMNSYFKNNITRRKISGGSFINVSSVGLSEDLRIKFKENGAIDYYEAILPAWSKEFVNEEGFFDYNSLPEELKNGLVYRIPTEDKYSIFSIKVVGFTPAESGGVIMLPKAITTIAGLDFDVDKVFGMMYSFFKDKEGKMHKIKYEDDVSKAEYTKSTSDGKKIAKEYNDKLKSLFETKTNLKDEISDWSKYFDELREDLLNLKKDSSVDKIINVIFNKDIDGMSAATEEQLVDELESTDEEVSKIRESIRSISSEIKDIVSERNSKLESLVSEEEFKAVPKEYKVSKKARDNRKIDILRAVFSDPNTLEAQLNPGNFDIIKKTAKDIGESSLGSLSDPSTLVEVHQRNMAGLDLIGIFANHNVSHALVQYNDVKFTSPVIFDETEYSKLGDENGHVKVGDRRISKELASFLAAVVDNAKEPLASFVNLNTYTADTVATMVRLGISTEDVLYLMSQPILKRFTDIYYNKGGNFSSEKEAIDQISKEAGINPEQLISLGKPTFDTKNLKKTLNEDVSSDNQKGIFVNFLKFKQNQVDALSNFISAYRVDSGAGPTIAHNNKSVKDIGRANSSEILDISDWLKSDNSKSIRYFHEYGVIEANKTITKITGIPFNSETFNYLSEVIFANFPKTKSLSVRDYNKLYSEAMDFIATGHEFFDIDSNERSRIASELPKAMEKVIKESSGKYEILKFLSVSGTKSKKVPGKFNREISFYGNSGLTKTQIDLIKSSWNDMYKDNSPAYEGSPSTMKEVAENLVKYTFIRNGFKLGPNTFSHLIPVELYESIVNSNGVTFNDYYSSTIDTINEGKLMDGSTIIDQYIRNNFTSLSYVPKIEEVKGEQKSISVDKEFKSKYGYTDPHKILYLPDYVKVVNDDGTSYLYALDLDSEVYYQIQPLGITNQFQEYKMNTIQVESIFNDEVKVDRFLSDNIRDDSTEVRDIVEGEEDIKAIEELDWKIRSLKEEIYKNYTTGKIPTGNYSKKEQREIEDEILKLDKEIDRLKSIGKDQETISNKTSIDFQEESTSGYRNRTIKNASADATIALAVNFQSAGEKLTKSSVLRQSKKYIPIDANNLIVTELRVNKIIEALNSVNARTLNIAGNGIYTMKGKYTQQQIDNFTYDLLNQVLNSSNLKNKIETLRSGGQTGFDEAGAKAGIKLGIPTIVLAPKGWTFRNVEGKDIYNKQKFKDRFNLDQIKEPDKQTGNDKIPPCV